MSAGNVCIGVVVGYGQVWSASCGCQAAKTPVVFRVWECMHITTLQCQVVAYLFGGCACVCVCVCVCV
jgi:hypothetical protein